MNNINFTYPDEGDVKMPGDFELKPPQPLKTLEGLNIGQGDDISNLFDSEAVKSQPKLDPAGSPRISAYVRQSDDFDAGSRTKSNNAQDHRPKSCAQPEAEAQNINVPPLGESQKLRDAWIIITRLQLENKKLREASGTQANTDVPPPPALGTPPCSSTFDESRAASRASGVTKAPGDEENRTLVRIKMPRYHTGGKFPSTMQNRDDLTSPERSRSKSVCQTKHPNLLDKLQANCKICKKCIQLVRSGDMYRHFLHKTSPCGNVQLYRKLIQAIYELHPGHTLRLMDIQNYHPQQFQDPSLRQDLENLKSFLQEVQNLFKTLRTKKRKLTTDIGKDSMALKRKRTTHENHNHGQTGVKIELRKTMSVVDPGYVHLDEMLGEAKKVVMENTGKDSNRDFSPSPSISNHLENDDGRKITMLATNKEEKVPFDDIQRNTNCLKDMDQKIDFPSFIKGCIAVQSKVVIGQMRAFEKKTGTLLTDFNQQYLLSNSTTKSEQPSNWLQMHQLGFSGNNSGLPDDQHELSFSLDQTEQREASYNRDSIYDAMAALLPLPSLPLSPPSSLLSLAPLQEAQQLPSSTFRTHSPILRIPDSPVRPTHSPISPSSPIHPSHSSIPPSHSPISPSHSPILPSHSPTPPSHSPIRPSHSPTLQTGTRLPHSPRPKRDAATHAIQATHAPHATLATRATHATSGSNATTPLQRMEASESDIRFANNVFNFSRDNSVLRTGSSFSSHFRTQSDSTRLSSLDQSSRSLFVTLSICKWCGFVCKNGLLRHLHKCEDGFFEAVCYAIRAMFGNSKYKIKSNDVKYAYCEVIESTERKAELVSRIKERMTNRIKSKITHMVRAPRSNGPGYKAFQGLEAMVCLFFRLFNLKMPFAAGLDSYNFTGFDADISGLVKKFILRWILMTRKTAGRDGLNAIGYTSQDSLSNGDCKVILDMSPEDWNALEKEEFSILHDKSDDLKKLGSMVKHFELRLFNLAPKEKFKWLRCFLVTLREFSVEALELKTLPNGDVKYRNLESDECKGVLASMSTFVMQNYDKLVKSFRDVVASQDHETELRLQLLRAILAMPSDRLTSHLITLAEELVRRLSKDVPDRFSSRFGDVSLITSPGFLSPSEILSIVESAQTDLCHFVHVQGSRSSRMCLFKKGILKPISEDQDNLHSTALDLFINRGLNSKALSSLPDFINSRTLRITSNEQWKAMSLETKSASEFAKLDALIITKCAITKLEIGAFLKRFQYLRCLCLVNNDISTLQPGVFDHLSRLEILDLSFNSIASIPSGVFKACKSLREVHLGSNKIRTLSPRAFEGLSHLKILGLGYNKIHSFAKDVFHGLESLERLNLYQNKLQRFPVGLFQTLKLLRKLDLSNNQLQSLDKGTFDDLKSLEELNLHFNKLQRLPVGLFQTLISLMKLDLSNNQLQSLDKGTLGDFKSLRELYLSFNQLQSLGKGTFDDLKSLRELDLRSNQLQSLDERTFDDLRWLRELYLNNNQLQSLGKWTFGDLKSLEELDLSDNKLQRLPVGLFQTPKWLRKLNLSFNQLQSLVKGTFDDLKSLEELNLHSNKLQRLPVGLFQTLMSLMKLDLSNNQLQSLDKGTLDDFKSFEELVLSNNKLQRLPAGVLQTLKSFLYKGTFDGLKSLRKLNLSNNQLQSLDKGTFNDLKSLEELDLLGNKLHRLPLGLFQTPKSLRKLNLSFNQLQSLDKGTFDDLKSLRALDLRLNQLQSLDKGTFDDLKSLRELYLNNNELQSLDKGTFDDLKSLEELDLSNTKLQRLPLGLFQTLKSLRKLDLRSNQLQSLDKGTFADLKSLKYLELEKNPLDYTKVDPTTFDSLNEVEMHPELPTIRNRMRETPGERKKPLESKLFPKKFEGLRQQKREPKRRGKNDLNPNSSRKRMKAYANKWRN